MKLEIYDIEGCWAHKDWSWAGLICIGTSLSEPHFLLAMLIILHPHSHIFLTLAHKYYRKDLMGQIQIGCRVNELDACSVSMINNLSL
jgi:hypothetical protein